MLFTGVILLSARAPLAHSETLCRAHSSVSCPQELSQKRPLVDIRRHETPEPQHLHVFPRNAVKKYMLA